MKTFLKRLNWWTAKTTPRSVARATRRVTYRIEAVVDTTIDAAGLPLLAEFSHNMTIEVRAAKRGEYGIRVNGTTELAGRQDPALIEAHDQHSKTIRQSAAF